MNFFSLHQNSALISAKGILLDLDNTLYEYAPCHRAGISATFDAWKNAFPNYSEKDFMSAYAEAREKIHKRLTGQSASHSRFLYFQTMLEEELGKTNFSEALLLEEKYWSVFLNAMNLRAGALDFLKKMKTEGKKVCIVTDLTSRLQFQKVEQLGISEHIEYLVSSEEAGAEKPHRRIFELALQKLRLAPEEAVVIGDDEKRDIAGAEALRIPSIHYDNEP